MSKDEKYPPINVLNIMRGFRTPDLPHAVTPYRFELRSGEKHHIKKIRQTHRERVGKAYHYHYVVVTKEERYFHLVFDSGTMVWRVVQEVDSELFFG
ncbi:MAG: hypothetical protein GVY02_02025 [Bacteroidetes bacterium]|jgi:tryptophanase|nr:hypothetical protein [Bacteroidota bacterium]